MACTMREIDVLRDVGVVDESGSLDPQGVANLCRGLAEAWLYERSECPHCFENAYGPILRDANPLRKLLELFVSPSCAEALASDPRAVEMCRAWLRRYGLAP